MSEEISLGIVNSGLTPAEGMNVWNDNSQTVEDSFNFHVTNPTAHQPDSSAGDMVFEEQTQTLMNKTVSYTDGNHTYITTSGIAGDVLSIQTLQQPAPISGGDNTTDWGIGYDGPSGQNSVLAISGVNGLEIRHPADSDRIDIQVPENFVINSGTQTLHINTAYEAVNTLKVGGKGTFTNKLTVNAGGIDIDGGGLNIDAGGLGITDGVILQEDNTDTSNTGSSGSISTLGGVGITKRLFVGDDIAQTADKVITGGSNTIELSKSADMKLHSAADIMLSAQNVGINTATPAELLTIHGSDPGIWLQHDTVNEANSGHLDFTEDTNA